jgi:hypothetical protein
MGKRLDYPWERPAKLVLCRSEGLQLLKLDTVCLDEVVWNQRLIFCLGIFKGLIYITSEIL